MIRRLIDRLEDKLYEMPNGNSVVLWSAFWTVLGGTAIIVIAHL